MSIQADNIAVPAVYHNSIRKKLQAQASRNGRDTYQFPRQHGVGDGDITAFHAAQANWGPRPENWPAVLNVAKKVEYDIATHVPELWFDGGRLIIDRDNHPVKKHHEIPVTLSSQVEGWLLESIWRENHHLNRVDFWARLPDNYKQRNGQWREIYGITNIGNKRLYFRDKNGLTSWEERASTRERNSIKLGTGLSVLASTQNTEQAGKWGGYETHYGPYVNSTDPGIIPYGGYQDTGESLPATAFQQMGNEQPHPLVDNARNRKYFVEDTDDNKGDLFDVGAGFARDTRGTKEAFGDVPDEITSNDLKQLTRGFQTQQPAQKIGAAAAIGDSQKISTYPSPVSGYGETLVKPVTIQDMEMTNSLWVSFGENERETYRYDEAHNHFAVKKQQNLTFISGHGTQDVLLADQRDAFSHTFKTRAGVHNHGLPNDEIAEMGPNAPFIDAGTIRLSKSFQQFPDDYFIKSSEEVLQVSENQAAEAEENFALATDNTDDDDDEVDGLVHESVSNHEYIDWKVYEQDQRPVFGE